MREYHSMSTDFSHSPESRLYVGPTVLFVDAWCQQDSHVIMWRSWLWLVRGIHVDRSGRRWDRKGNPL